MPVVRTFFCRVIRSQPIVRLTLADHGSLAIVFHHH
jgi:hypothetical protein